jgi:hypothetical protein
MALKNGKGTVNGYKIEPHANLVGANLSGANLRDADLSFANLTDANLIGANLLGTNFYRATLTGAALAGTILSGANFYAATVSPNQVSDIKAGCDFMLSSLRVVGGRAPNPAPTDADMRNVSRQIDKMLGLDDLRGGPKAKPKPTYEIELRKGDHVEVYKFKTKRDAVARFEESAAKAEASNDPRFAGLIISLYCGDALTEQYRKGAKKATKRKPNPRR